MIACRRRPGFTRGTKGEPEEWIMPAKSKAQQKAAGAALAAKRGEQDKQSLKGASKQMEDSMSEEELEELASTERKSLPERKG
jgi:hypothetical protein